MTETSTAPYETPPTSGILWDAVYKMCSDLTSGNGEPVNPCHRECLSHPFMCALSTHRAVPGVAAGPLLVKFGGSADHLHEQRTTSEYMYPPSIFIGAAPRVASGYNNPAGSAAAEQACIRWASAGLFPGITTVNIRKTVSAYEHRGIHSGETGGVYIKVVKATVATTPSEFVQVLNSHKMNNPLKYMHMLRLWGVDKFSLGEDKFSLGEDKYSLGEDKFSLGLDSKSLHTDAYSRRTDAHSLGISKASKGLTKSQLGTAKFARQSNHGQKEPLPRDYAKVLKMLRECFSDDQLSIVLGTQRSAGAYNGCANKAPTNLYRLCNGVSAPPTFKGLRCFQPDRFEAIKQLFNASK